MIIFFFEIFNLGVRYSFVNNMDTVVSRALGIWIFFRSYVNEVTLEGKTAGKAALVEGPEHNAEDRCMNNDKVSSNNQ